MCDLLCQQGQRQYWPTGFSEYARRQSECPPATSLSAASTWWGVPGRDNGGLVGNQRRFVALVASGGLFSCLVSVRCGPFWGLLRYPRLIGIWREARWHSRHLRRLLKVLCPYSRTRAATNS